jgi:type IV secretory pathway VirB4 component
MWFKKIVSYFKYYFEFFEWFEYDERDKYKEPFEAYYTKDSYHTYIEAYDENDNLLSKTKDDMMISKYLEELTEFKLND